MGFPDITGSPEMLQTVVFFDKPEQVRFDVNGARHHVDLLGCKRMTGPRHELQFDYGRTSRNVVSSQNDTRMPK
jgi:hypothetical protein